MKKENRQMAQQRRAEERKKAEQQRKIKKLLSIGIPVVLAVALVIGLSVSALNKRQKAAEENEAAQQEAVTAQNETADESGTDSQEEPILNTDTALEVKDGDTVNIDYVGTVDGVEFDGGSTGGAGTDLTIGSGLYIDDFEEQLIGHKVGETVEVKATFPEDYGVEELNGKEAVFTTTINGIYE